MEERDGIVPLRVRVRETPDGRIRVLAGHPSLHFEEGWIEASAAAQMRRDVEDVLRRLRERTIVRDAHFCAGEREIGAALSLVFSPPAVRATAQELRAWAQQRGTLLIALDIATPSLKDLPWELLAFPDIAAPLEVGAGAMVVRLLPSPIQSPLPAPRRWSVGLWCPDRSDPTTSAVHQRLLVHLQEAGFGAPLLLQPRQAAPRLEPDTGLLLHLVAHGGTEGSLTRVLGTEGRAWGPDTPAAVLAPLLRHSHAVHLDVCEGGRPAADSLAAALMQAGARAVIAPLGRLDPATAEAYWGGYYQAIQQTGSVPRSVAAGRRALRAVATEDLTARWWTLALYLAGLEGLSDGARPAPSHPSPRWRSEAQRRLAEEADRLRSERGDHLRRGEDVTELDRRLRQIRGELRMCGRLQEGDVVADRYQLLHRIGLGAYGTVWRSLDRERQAIVALKVLHAEKGEDQACVARFVDGARQMAAMRHPNVVGALDEAAEDNGFHYFPMSYIDGPDLDQAVSERWRAPADPIEILLQIADALAYAHGRGIVHRDVKPANILLDGPNAMLTDFDLARPLEDGLSRSSAAGPVAYLAPEYGDPNTLPGPAADQYSLGMTAIFLLGGAAALQAARRDPAEALEGLGVSADVADVLRRALSWRPEDRFPSMAALRDALQLANKAPWRPVRRRDQTPRYPRLPLIAVALIVLALLILFTTLGVEPTRTAKEGLEARLAALAQQSEYADHPAEALALLRAAAAQRDAALSPEAVDRLIEKGAAAHWIGSMARGVQLNWARGAENIVWAMDALGHLQAWDTDTGGSLPMAAVAPASPPTPGPVNLRTAMSQPLGSVIALDDLVLTWDSSSRTIQSHVAAGRHTYSVVDLQGERIAASTYEGDLLVFQWGNRLPTLVRRVFEGGELLRLHFAARLSSGRDVIGLNGPRGFEVIGLDDNAQIWRDDDPRQTSVEVAASVSADNRHVAMAMADGTLRVRELESGTLQGEVHVRPRSNTRVSFSTDGRWLAATGPSGGVVLVDTVTWTTQEFGTDHMASRGRALTISTDARSIAYGDEAGQVWVIDPLLGRLRKLEGHGGAVQALAFDAHNGLLTGSDDGWLRLFAPYTLPSWVWRGRDDEDIAHIQFVTTQQGAFAVVLGRTSPVTLDAASGADLQSIEGDVVAMSDHLAFSLEQNKIFATDLVQGQRQFVARTEGDPLQPTGCVSRDGSRLIVAGPFRSWRLFDTAMGLPIATSDGTTPSVDCAFSPDGRRFSAIDSNQLLLRVWDRSGALGWEAKIDGQLIRSSAWSPDSRWVALGGEGGAVHVIDAATGATVHRLTGHAPGEIVFALAFSPDSTRLASGSFDGSVKIWDLSTGESLVGWQLPGAARDDFNDVNDLTYSPDGLQVLVASGEPAVRIYDAEHGTLVAALRAPSTELRRVAVSPDGRMIIATARQGQVAAWRTADIQPIPTTIEETGRLNNLRVCQDSMDVVPVNPFPDPATVWAPPEVCAQARR